MNAVTPLIERLLAAARQLAWVVMAIACTASPALALDMPDMSGLFASGNKATLEVADPFIEMHTGPGRGYPIFNVVEQGERIDILKRKTNWYQVQSADGKTGWTKAAQLAHTLKPTGEPVDLPEVGHGDYLRSRWRVGFTAGQFEGANSFSVTAGYRLLSWAGLEVEGGQIFDRSVTSDYYGANVFIEPMPQWVITPFVSFGAGEFSFDARQKVLIDEVGSASYSSYGAGANYYVGRNFLIRAEYRHYSLSTDDDSVGLNAWRIGLNTFF